MIERYLRTAQTLADPNPGQPKPKPDGPNRQHAKDGHFRHLHAPRVDAKGKVTKVYADERIIPNRHSTLHAQSVRAAAGSTAKTMVFCLTQRDTDRRLDTKPMTVQPNPGPAPARCHVEHRRRLNRSI